MKREIRNRERELFKKSMELKNMDLSRTNWEQSQEIRKMQNETWQRHIFYKNIIQATEKNKGRKR